MGRPCNYAFTGVPLKCRERRRRLGSTDRHQEFTYVHFSGRFIIGLDLFHLTAAVTFLMANLVCLITKKKWAATA